MGNKEIAKKYGIEPIMKEMWVWDGDKTETTNTFVLLKFTDRRIFPYLTTTGRSNISFANASETNPNDKEPKVGDKGYFWNNENYYCYDELKSINIVCVTFYQTTLDLVYSQFSHDRQPWME